MFDDKIIADLERANAQIDIWIDEEEYDKVTTSCNLTKKLAIFKADNGRRKSPYERAFDHDYCTAKEDDAWLAILDIDPSACPVSAVLGIPQQHDRIELTCLDYASWSHFFWAKLIRARIQQRGTECYYRRLDDVIVYLERHLPQVDPTKPHSALLPVVYLLEMAASGVDIDQQSFAERTRRLLKTAFGTSEYKNYFDFYDLLARYNNGVGFFHRGFYRQAVREFNFIIFKLCGFWSKGGDLTQGTNTFSDFVNRRHGLQLLYIPAVLYRADIQLKLQLAYHARNTLSKYFRAPSAYKQARANLIKAEAYQQMGRPRQTWQALKETYEFAVDSSTGLESRENVRPFRATPGERLANLRGRLQNLLIAEHLEYLRESWRDIPIGELKQYLSDLSRFFEQERVSSEHQRSNRGGYLEQIAEYISLLAQKNRDQSKEVMENKSVLEIEAREIYSKNKEDILRSEYKVDSNQSLADTLACPSCGEKGIDLRRLDEYHYDTFTKNIRRSLKELVKKNNMLRGDQRFFLDRLRSLEKDRENLSWRLRNIELEAHQDHFQKSWCNNCTPKSSPFLVSCFKRKSAFGGLLECAGPFRDEKYNGLSAKDYEQIMDHWDEHFLEHMRNPSFHEPRCRGLHFLGLQRWNSSSPAQGRSLGGGYLIYHTGKHGCIDLGVAIDPGFDFLRNLFHVGFSLSDIDIVLLSHAHVDHVRDFESMVTLLLELRKRTRNHGKEIKRKLHAIMTLGVYRRLEYIIESPGLRKYIEPYILDIEKEIDQDFLDKSEFKFIQEKEKEYSDNVEPPTKTSNSIEPSRLRFVPVLKEESAAQAPYDGILNVTITPTKAYHNDFSEYSDSFGFIISIKDPEEPGKSQTFGYTGDTSWKDDIIERYKRKKCDTLLVHLGSLIDREDPQRTKFSHYRNAERCFDLIRDKNHPYLMGILHFLTEILQDRDDKKKPLILIGEFGEELRGRIRLDFIGRLKEAYGAKLEILPVDVGLDVLLACDSSKECQDPSISNKTESNPKIWCVQCKHFVALDDSDFIHYGHDEALFCVCKTCQKATPVNVLQERLRALYEVGRRLQIH